MDLLKDIVEQHGAELVERLTADTGLDTAQAQRFVPALGAQLQGALAGAGGPDLGALIGAAGGAGGLQELIGRLDIGALAGAAGTAEPEARRGVETLLPLLLGWIGERAGGGANGLLDALGSAVGSAADSGSESAQGGLLGAAGKLAGGLFGRN